MHVVVESRIVGTFLGYAPGVVHRLDDGSECEQVGNVREYVYRERPGCRVVREHERLWIDVEGTSGVAEVSLYVAASARGRGVGTTLLRALIEASEGAGIWTLQGSILPENAASRALVKRCEFREVGRRERIGQMKDVWRDTILVERRSRVVGV